MNGLDIAILIILVLFVIKGALRGLIKELCSLIGLVMAAVIAFHYYTPLAEKLAAMSQLPLQLCVIITLVLLFVATMIIFTVIGAVLSRFIRLLFLGGFNRVLGALFSLLQGTFVLALVLYGLSLAQLPSAVKPQFKKSQLRPPFVELGESMVKLSVRYLDKVS
nr:CvpA family protein [uncultured Desulfuromonas sp.]